MGLSLGLIEIGEEVFSDLIRSGVEEEEREMLEIAAEGVKFEEEMQVGDGVVGSWARVIMVPGLVGSHSVSVCLSYADNSDKDLWVRDGVAVFKVRVGCVPSLVGR